MKRPNRKTSPARPPLGRSWALLLLAAVSLSAQPISLVPLAGGFDSPLALTHAGDGSGRLFVTEQPGRIFVIRDGTVLSTPFLDIRDRVRSGGEQGLLSVAFHPRYEENGFFYVDYTDNGGDTVVARYSVSSANPDVANPDSEFVILTVDQPYTNHNGGQLQFGPDGYLWIGMGDGGHGGDPHNHAQNLLRLLGKLLRIDVDSGQPYAIPPNNPFATVRDARPEIWAVGLRNPWRFSFDRATGDLWIGDVGQAAWEEIDYLKAPLEPANFGWRIMEGMHCYNSSSCSMIGLTLPILEYGRALGCSVSGGYVYRGTEFLSLRGTYLYGDFCSGRIWGARRGGSGEWQSEVLLDTTLSISSFGEDEAGELYVVDLGGTVHRVLGPTGPSRRRLVRRE